MHPFPSFSRFLNRGNRMRNTRRTESTIRFLTRPSLAVLLAVGGLTIACEADSPTVPSPQAPRPTQPPAASPIAVSGISPSSGSTGGDTPVEIAGSGFQAGATATVDGVQRSVSVQGSTTIRFSTPAHGTGQVDVVVTNPDGQAARLAGAYTYVPPESFDFNGEWVGYALAHPGASTRFTTSHGDMEMRFTIANGRLVDVTCGTTSALALAPPPSVSNGQFSFVEGENVVISGRIVSARGAVGGINTGPCPATRWVATKQ